jgi:hypothetical protein
MSLELPDDVEDDMYEFPVDDPDPADGAEPVEARGCLLKRPASASTSSLKKARVTSQSTTSKSASSSTSDAAPNVSRRLNFDNAVDEPPGAVAKPCGTWKATMEALPANDDLVRVLDSIISIPRFLDGSLPDDVMEIFSMPRVCPVARQRGLRAEVSMDLQNGWNFSSFDARQQAVHEVVRRRPKVIILTPPCDAWMASNASNWRLEDRRPSWATLTGAALLLDFAAWLALHQKQEGRGYVFEHQAPAISWKRESIARLLSGNAQNHKNRDSTFDVCMFSLAAPSTTRMRTTFRSNMHSVYAKFAHVFCDKSHSHAKVRNAKASSHPAPLSLALAKCVHEYCNEANVIEGVTSG